MSQVSGSKVSLSSERRFWDSSSSYGPYIQQVADALHEGVMDDIFSETKGLISKGTDCKTAAFCTSHFIKNIIFVNVSKQR